MNHCTRCTGRGYLPEARKASKRNPNALGFYARTCPACNGTGQEVGDTWTFEYTDTFGGEANYSWVKRGTFKVSSNLAAVRKAKALAGLSGVACARSEFNGDTIELRPYGSATVLFITWKES